MSIENGSTNFCIAAYGLLPFSYSDNENICMLLNLEIYIYKVPFSQVKR